VEIFASWQFITGAGDAWSRDERAANNGSWRTNETYVRVAGRWTYLYRAVDSTVPRSISYSPKRATWERPALLPEGFGRACHSRNGSNLVGKARRGILIDIRYE
jgi:DDE superfamily endonuclease